MAKDTRQQFRTTWQLITDWLEKAEGRDVTDLDVVTYETLDDQLQQHKVSFCCRKKRDIKLSAVNTEHVKVIG